MIDLVRFRRATDLYWKFEATIAVNFASLSIAILEPYEHIRNQLKDRREE